MTEGWTNPGDEERKWEGTTRIDSPFLLSLEYCVNLPCFNASGNINVLNSCSYVIQVQQFWLCFRFIVNLLYHKCTAGSQRSV